MEKKTTGIIATVATVLLCGIPGLCLCLFGGLAAAGILPYTTEFGGQTSSGTVPPTWGYAGICLALILIAIPVIVGIVTLRKKPEAESMSDEPVPPAI